MYKIILLLFFLSNTLFATAIIKGDLTEDFELEYFYDKTKKLSIDEISNSNFKKKIPSQFSLGYISGNSWFKITAKNESDAKNFILYFTEPYFEEVNLYKLENNSWQKSTNGLFIPLEKRDINDHNPAFNIILDKSETKIFYIQTFNRVGSFAEFKIFEKNAFFETYKIYNMSLYLIYFGGLFIIIAFNLFLYLKLKDKIFLYYVGYTTFFTLFISLFSGFSLYLGLQNWHYELHISPPLFIIFLILFSVNFLEIKKYNSNLKKIFDALIVFFISLTILLFVSIEPWYEVLSSTASIVFLLLSSSAIYVWKKGHTTAKYYIFALSVYIVTIALMSSLANGWLENNDINRYAFLFGSYFEIIFFSLMLANRFYIIQKDRIKIKDELLEIKNTNEKILEEQIKQRTRDILKVNSKLETALNDKVLLLKELNHRVKNNFHMMISLLWIESEKIKNSETHDNFLNLISRIKSMATVHQFLYDSSSLSEINSTKYMDNIVFELNKIYDSKNISIKKEIDKFDMDIDCAMSLSIIINETISNSIKYTDEKKDCEIFIVLKKIEDQITLTIQDNGIGFEDTKEYEGLGLKLVKQFANKLKNSYFEYKNENGTKFTLFFNLEN